MVTVLGEILLIDQQVVILVQFPELAVSLESTSSATLAARASSRVC